MVQCLWGPKILIFLNHFPLNFHSIKNIHTENLKENGSKKSIFMDPINIEKNIYHRIQTQVWGHGLDGIEFNEKLWL